MIRRLFLFLSPFLLLLAACSRASEEEFDEFSFTAEEMEEISSRIDAIENQQTGSAALIVEMEEQLTGTKTVVLDIAQAEQFTSLRSVGMGPTTENMFRVTNAFVNVRTAPSVQAEKMEELTKGDQMKLLSFPNAAWAEVELMNGRKGFVNVGYIAEMATEQTLPELKKKYEGQYYVDFAFLNVRASPTSQGQKLGELLSNQIVKPLAIHDKWARLAFEGKEGFVSAEYLRPFLPAFIVRQEQFALPILRYRGDEVGIADALVRHLAFLKSSGKTLMTLREFYELLLEQEERDVRLPPDVVLLAFSDVDKTSLKDIADALRATGVHATFFLKTSDIGTAGISTQFIQTLIANGHDVGSAGHSGDDLRALTNAEIMLELSQSKQILHDLMGKDVLAIAYPGGGMNDRVLEQANAAGYLFGLTLNPSAGGTFNRNQFLQLPASSVSATTTEATLKALLGILP